MVAALMIEDSLQQSDWPVLMAAVVEHGDKQAFMQIYDHFAPRLVSYLQAQGASTAQAEELAQEAMLNVWRKAPLYQADKAALSTWIFRIARNLYIDSLRRQRMLLVEWDDQYEQQESFDSPQLEGGDDHLVEARIKAAMESLPNQQAQVVYKSFFESKSHSEIAADMDLPLGSVKSSLRLAFQKLRQALGGPQ